MFSSLCFTLPMAAASTVMSGHAAPRPYRHPVAIWIPPYAVAKSEEQLKLDGLQHAITHLSLQFWVPTKTGQAVLDSSPEVTNATIDGLRDWAHARGIRVMLCVYNGAKDWDWALAKTAFGQQQGVFVKSLVEEMERHHLDGIDIDLEGPAQYEPDKPAFLAFMTQLSKEVHAQKKQLSVDSFCYKWNAPNQGWWPELFPLVDSITSMGYQDTGIAPSQDWASYASQVKAAGSNAAKLQIGVPSDRAKWQGNTALEQLAWIQKSGASGVGIWDAQLPSASWRAPEIWSTLKAIRAGG